MKMDTLKLVGRNTVDFPIVGADVSGPFILKGVDGLGPTDITVRLGRTVLEKAVYQGKSATLRQITAVVGLQPDWDAGQTPEELRKVLYGLLTPVAGQMIRAEIWYGGDQQGFAQGNISKMVPVLFSKDPAVQIVIDCDYGYLLAPGTVSVEPDASDFITGGRQFTIDNDGDAPSGFKAGFILGAAPSPNHTLTLFTSDGAQTIEIEGITWASGDKFLVDTRPGSRGVWRGPGGGAYVSCLNNLNVSVSEWMYIYGGETTLVLDVSDFDWDPTYDFAYQPAYWGV